MRVTIDLGEMEGEVCQAILTTAGYKPQVPSLSDARVMVDNPLSKEETINKVFLRVAEAAVRAVRSQAPVEGITITNEEA